MSSDEPLARPAQFEASRLRLARERRGLTQDALAKACEVSRRIVAAWEIGEKIPSAAALERLAGALAFPTGFFFLDEPDELSPEAATFRALSKTPARERNRALAAGKIALDLTRWIDAQFVLPEPGLPDLRGADPESAARTVRAEWGLGEEPIPNLVHLLEAKGVRVFSLAEDTDNVDAFSVWRRGVPFVFLNTRKSAERDRMDAAHELGHLVLHRGHDAPRGRTREQQAEAFASAFLMPESSILAFVPVAPVLPQLVHLKQIWRVSVAALLYRLNALGLLSEWRNRQLWVELGRLGYRRTEPNSVPRESSQVLSKVMAALRADGGSRHTLAAELCIPTAELDALMFGLVLLPVEGRGQGGGLAQGSLRIV